MKEEDEERISEQLRKVVGPRENGMLFLSLH